MWWLSAHCEDNIFLEEEMTGDWLGCSEGFTVRKRKWRDGESTLSWREGSDGPQPSRRVAGSWVCLGTRSSWFVKTIVQECTQLWTFQRQGIRGPPGRWQAYPLYVKGQAPTDRSVRLWGLNSGLHQPKQCQESALSPADQGLDWPKPH